MGEQNKYETRLRIESVRGSPINDYRIKGGEVEVRVLTTSGHPYPDWSGRWRILDDNDIQLHHALGTIVSKWLQVRLDTAAVALDEAG
jgi:hypothetical protein